MHYPGIKIQTSTSLKALSLALLLVLLVACSTAPQEANSFTQRDSHLITVPFDDAISNLESRYNGTVIATTDSHAVLSVNLSDEAFITLSDQAEANTDSFQAGAGAWMSGRSTAWAGGRSTAWAGGRSSAWAGGRSSAWAGGEFSWMPENTAVWQQINLEEGQALSENLGLDIKVAIIDTGVDLNHPALIEALAPADEWYDFVDDDMIPQEEGELGEGGFGHGTNVAGIVRQIAPRATILPIRVLSPDGSGYISDLVEAIIHAVDMGADVINLSLGSTKSSKSVKEAIKYAKKHGVLVVASAGNTGDNKVTYPASDSNDKKTGKSLLSVTSVDLEDNKSIFAAYDKHIEMAAPGENIYGPAPDLRVAGWSGTSMAAPIATGMLALALGEATGLKVNKLEKIMQDHSSELYDHQNEDYKNKIGEGRVDVEAFMTEIMK